MEEIINLFNFDWVNKRTFVRELPHFNASNFVDFNKNFTLENITKSA